MVASAAGAACAAELPNPADVTPERYATGFAFAEGPAFDDAGNLYVVNYRVEGTIGKFAADGTASVFCDLVELAPTKGDKEPRGNGIKIDRECRLIVADSGAGRLLRVSADGTAAEVLAERFNEIRFNSINDVALDTAGNVYFTDPGGSSIETPIGSVYRYDVASRGVTRLDTGLAFPNGIAVSPDQKRLCVAESQRSRVLMYDLSPDGAVKNRRVLIDFAALPKDAHKHGPPTPDGMIFDEDGRLFVAMWKAAVVNVIELPTGKLLAQYDAGGSQATNLHFHDGWLYVTVAAKEAVYRLKLGVDGHRYRGGR
jgi:gluconolactonase